LQSALTKTGARAKPAKKPARKPRTPNVSELFLAELAARRVRLQELLRMIRLEATRESEFLERSQGRACKKLPARRLRGQAAVRAARTD
jgi:hypothetical protein